MSLSRNIVNTLVAGAMTAGFASQADAGNKVTQRDVGEVSTVFRLIGPNDKIKVLAFNDPSIEGVTCWLSRPTSGGISGGLGFAEQKSNTSIACRQTGPIKVVGEIEKGMEGEEVFNESRSVWFKELHVTRFF